MFLIVGLGNPLPEYKMTRHNAGQIIVSIFQEKNDFPEFKLKKKFNCLISEKNIGQQKIILALPQTFINNSGQAVQKIIKNYKSEIKNLIVLHDDLALPLGKIRIKKDGSSGGHNGVQSIINHLGSQGFARLKIGIEPNAKLKTQNAKPQLKIQDLKRFVLQKFNKEEKNALLKITDQTIETINKILKNKKIENKTIVVS